MNDYFLKQAETKNKQAFEQLQYFLKKMSWRISVPIQLQNLIILFMYPTFLKHIYLYTLISDPVPLISGLEFLLESQKKIVKIHVDKQWNAFKDSRQYFIQLQRPIIMDFIIKRTHQKLQRIIIGTEQQIQLVEDSIKYIRQRLKGWALFGNPRQNVLNRLISKNFIRVHGDDRSYWIFQNQKDQIDFMEITILFDSKTKIWTIKGPIIWKRQAQISRKKQFVRLSSSILLQSENGQVSQLPSNYFWLSQRDQITHFIL